MLREYLFSNPAIESYSLPTKTIESYLYKRNRNKEAHACPITITKLDVVRNMFKSAIEYTFTRRSITTTGKTINTV
jgi:hypothetical protein